MVKSHEHHVISDHPRPNKCFTTVSFGLEKKKHQRSTLLALFGRNHRSPVDSPHKGPVIRCFHITKPHDQRSIIVEQFTATSGIPVTKTLASWQLSFAVSWHSDWVVQCASIISRWNGLSSQNKMQEISQTKFSYFDSNFTEVSPRWSRGLLH